MSGEPLLGKEKAVPGSERDPTRCHPDRQGKGGGGLYEVRQKRGSETEGRKKMVGAERRGRGD